MKNFLTIILLFCSLLTGCFNTSQYQHPHAQLHHSAKIIIMRPNKIFGSPINAPVYVNNVYIGRVGINGYLTWYTPPGVTTVSTDAGVANYVFDHKNVPSVLAFNAAKNKTYYIKLTFPNQVILMTPGYELELLTKKEGEIMLNGMRKITSNTR